MINSSEILMFVNGTDDFYGNSTKHLAHHKAGQHEGGVFSGHDPLNTDLAKFLVQSIIIIGLSRFLHIFLSKIGQPRVIAEIIGGICLGPSVLGNIPGFTDKIFPKSSLTFLSTVANIGLVFYLFLVGLELEPQAFFNNFRRSAMISLSGIVLPFGVGIAASWGLYNHLLIPNENNVPFASFLLFTGVAMSLTAFPVLARILSEKKMTQTEVGLLAISAAAMDDALAWTLLALVVSILNAGDNLTALYVFLVALGFALLFVIGIRPLLDKLFNRFLAKSSNPISQFFVAAIFIFLYLSAWITELIGVNVIFGAFLFGLILPRGNNVALRLMEKIEDVIIVGFLPLFFAASGLKTNIGLLNDGTTWAWLFGVIGVACFGKMFGCTMTARLTGIPWREAFSVGVLMNSKGLVELIVLNIGLEARVINERIFLLMVIMALVTTFMTSPIIGFIYPPKYYTRPMTLKPTRRLSLIRRSMIKPPSMAKTNGGVDNDESSVEQEQIRALVCIEEPNAVSVVAELLWLFKTGDKRRDQDNLIINTLKIVETSERSSSILKASKVSEAIRMDPGLNMMTLFGKLVNAVTHNFMAFSSPSDLADEVNYVANTEECNLIVLPWFEQTVFGTIMSSSPQEKIRNVINSAEPTTVVYVPSRRLGLATSLPVPKKILLPFFGGSNDCEAAKIALRFHQRTDVTLTVLKISLTQGTPQPVLANGTPVVSKVNRSTICFSGLHLQPQADLDQSILDEIQGLSSVSGLVIKTVDQCYDAIACVMGECQAYQYDLIVVGRNYELALDSANKMLGDASYRSTLAEAGTYRNTLTEAHDMHMDNGLSLIPPVLSRSQSECHSDLTASQTLTKASSDGTDVHVVSIDKEPHVQRGRPTIVTEILGKLGQTLYESEVAPILVVHKNNFGTEFVSV